MYNKVRNFSVREDKRKNRLMDKEDKATTEKALDPKTRVLIYKLVNGGLLDSVNGVISMGKEAVIFHADGGPGPQDCHRPKPYNVPKECVLKVFKTTLNEFKTRDKYIRVSNKSKVSHCICLNFAIAGRLQVPQKIHQTESSEDPQHVGGGEGGEERRPPPLSAPDKGRGATSSSSSAKRTGLLNVRTTPGALPQWAASASVAGGCPGALPEWAASA